MKKIIAFCMVAMTIACAKENPIVSGTFEGTGEGRNGAITVAVTLEDSVIKNIELLASEETESIAAPVFTDMLDTMIDQNNVNVDFVSGATMSSEGFKNAVMAALKEAGVDLNGKKIPINASEPEEAVQDFDVVVIGGGGAGFSAAIEAINNGAGKVVLLEKLRSVGGSTLISGAGVNAAGTWMQEQFGIEDSEELFYQDSLKGGDNLGTPELIRHVTANADEAVIWLSNYIGVPYRTYVQQFGGHTVPRSHNPEGHSGEGMINLMNQKAQELGVVVKTGTEALDLIMTNGRVVGVVAKKGGQEIIFNASKAVVIASGGFGANVAMRTKYNPEFDENYLATVSSGNTGDGIIMAEKLGADTIGMEFIQTYPTANPITGVISYVANTRFNGAFLVNKEGNRFVEEMGRRDDISKAILEQTDGFGYLVWNEEIGNIGDVMEGNKKEYDALVRQNLIVKADTIEEAAEFFGIPSDAIRATLTKVNQYAADGNDPDFNHRRGLVAMNEGPFYIQKVVPSIHHTMGGLKIDVEARVLDTNSNPIPGLYAAGEVTGGIHGSNRLGGNAIADIVVFGRTAGRNAAQN